MEYSWVLGEGAGFEDAKTVRQAVFCEEQGFENEFDALDGQSWHLVGRQNGAPVCTARLYLTTPQEAHAGRIAVCAAQRGQRLGEEMMRRLLQKAAQLGAKKVLLDAQADKRPFYQKQGFAPTGNTSLDEGMPHVEMVCRLD